MRLATYTSGTTDARIAAVLNEPPVLLDLLDADPGNPAFRSMQHLIEAGPVALDRVRQLIDRPGTTIGLSEVTLLAPVPVPQQIRDFSVFPGHIKGAPAGMARLAALARGDAAAAAAVQPLPEVPDVYRNQPIYYLSNRFSVVGPEAVVRWPRYSDVMDFELEFGVFLSKGGKNIARADAAKHIFGYTVYNDFSARDAQRIEMQGMLGPAKGKSFDCGNAMGPWIVTADEFPQGPVRMTVRVNNETWASGTTADMLHTFADMIAWVSQDETLYAGEFFGSGTMGNGCGLEQGRFLNDGDVVEAEVEGIGILRNSVRRQPPP